MDDHPFEVGGVFKNEDGAFEVLAIEGKEMRVRFEDGAERELNIAIQARIWQRYKDEAAGPPPRPRGMGHQSQAVQPIIDLVAEVLAARFKAPYSPDITYQVVRAIEDNPDWLSRYHSLVEHYSSGGKKGRDIVNSSIGFWTKELTGKENIGEGKTAKSSLIQYYLLGDGSTARGRD